MRWLKRQEPPLEETLERTVADVLASCPRQHRNRRPTLRHRPRTNCGWTTSTAQRGNGANPAAMHREREAL